MGEAHAQKSLRIALSASLDLTLGIGARLHAPFNASAVIKSLIKLMSDLPGEPGAGEEEDRGHRQPSASNVLMLQPLGPSGSHSAGGQTRRAAWKPVEHQKTGSVGICRLMPGTDAGVCSSF